MVSQKSSGLPWFTQAYPLEGCHFSGERGRALRAPRRPRRPRQPGDPRLSPLASEDRMTMARGHSCRSRFEEFSAAIANWCSSMKFNPASYDIFIDVLFCQVQQVQWISELQIGAPDFNGC